MDCEFWTLLTVLVLPKRKRLTCHVLCCRICRTFCLSCVTGTSIAFIVDARWAFFGKLSKLVFFYTASCIPFILDAFSFFVQYESPEALAKECPGPDEDDHWFVVWRWQRIVFDTNRWWFYTHCNDVRSWLVYIGFAIHWSITSFVLLSLSYKHNKH